MTKLGALKSNKRIKPIHVDKYEPQEKEKKKCYSIKQNDFGIFYILKVNILTFRSIITLNNLKEKNKNKNYICFDSIHE